MMIKRISSVLLMALATWGINVKAYDSGVNVGDLLKHGGTVVKAAQHLRKGVTDITPEEEHYIGRAVAAQILGRYPPNKAQGVTDYLNTIGRYLTYYSTQPETFAGYHFMLIESKEVNAFSAPGGLIMVTTGLFRLVQTEEQLAAVLAHEIAHVTLKHGLSAIKSSNLTKAFGLIANEAITATVGNDLKELTAVFGSSINDVVGKLVSSGYSRSQEYAADQEGLNIVYRAGFDPAGYAEFLMALQGHTANLRASGGFFKTHPPAGERLSRIQRAITAGKLFTVAEQARTRRFLGSADFKATERVARAPAKPAIKYSPVVKEIQTRLSQLGYDPGPADGLFGRKTKIAIVAYQRKMELPADGKPTEAVREHLRQSMSQAGEVTIQPFGNLTWDDTLFEAGAKLKEIRGIDKVMVDLGRGSSSCNPFTTGENLMRCAGITDVRHTERNGGEGTMPVYDKVIYKPAEIIRIKARPVVLAGAPFKVLLEYRYEPGLIVHDPERIGLQGGYFPFQLRRVELSSTSPALLQALPAIANSLAKKYGSKGITAGPGMLSGEINDGGGDLSGNSLQVTCSARPQDGICKLIYSLAPVVLHNLNSLHLEQVAASLRENKRKMGADRIEVEL